MEEKVRPSQHVTTLTTHTHTHQLVTVVLLQWDTPWDMCNTTFPLIPRQQPKGQGSSMHVQRDSIEQGAENRCCAASTAGRH